MYFDSPLKSFIVVTPDTFFSVTRPQLDNPRFHVGPLQMPPEFRQWGKAGAKAPSIKERVLYQLGALPLHIKLDPFSGEEGLTIRVDWAMERVPEPHHDVATAVYGLKLTTGALRASIGESQPDGSILWHNELVVEPPSLLLRARFVAGLPSAGGRVRVYVYDGPITDDESNEANLWRPSQEEKLPSKCRPTDTIDASAYL